FEVEMATLVPMVAPGVATLGSADGTSSRLGRFFAVFTRVAPGVATVGFTDGTSSRLGRFFAVFPRVAPGVATLGFADGTSSRLRILSFCQKVLSTSPPQTFP
ncbi:MAG: hypothetical protein ACAH95_06635, partial [Fimbriimonas sp.]